MTLFIQHPAFPFIIIIYLFI